MRHLLLLLLLAPLAPAQRGGRPNSDTVQAVTEKPGIAWYGVLEDARVEAARTGRPILLMSAAPLCTGVPGMW